MRQSVINLKILHQNIKMDFFWSMKYFKKNIAYKLALSVFLLLILTGILPCLISGSRLSSPEISIINENTKLINQPSDSLKIITLNLAHGRGTEFTQLLTPKADIKNNLNTIGKIIYQEKPDIIGFQEADGSSLWSGNFNHVEYISRVGGLSEYFQGFHINTPGLRYGTAIASRETMTDQTAQTFRTIPFLPPKGFSAVSIKWPDKNKPVTDIIVIHLDFLSESIRNQQIENIASFMKSRKNNRFIVMGDFNSSWENRDSSVRQICSLMNLHAYEPFKNQPSFPLSGKRIDWILISGHFKFISYKVSEQQMSDHLAVIAEIGLN